jgi:hypothetical protein
MLITTNRVYKYWSQIFNNDSTLTSAILVIEGKSFRIKKRDRRVDPMARRKHRTEP